MGERPARRFNTRGLCIPGRHYMVDLASRVRTVTRTLIEPGEYFVINRARQYGKTTLLRAIREHITTLGYLPVHLSFEGREELFTSRPVFAKGFARLVGRQLAATRADLAGGFPRDGDPDLAFAGLGDWITTVCREAGAPVVLIIDEVDKAANYEVFATFLGLLRDMYLTRLDDETPAFHCVILAGLHDIKNLRRRIRPDSEHTLNSPWNIAAPFTLDMAFSPGDIATMLQAYEADHATGMDIRKLADRLHFYTRGYPFLVSRLCQIIDDDALTWDDPGLDRAVTSLLNEHNTLFDDLIKNIDNHPELTTLCERLLINGETLPASACDPVVEWASGYGILTGSDGRLTVSNPVFETLIYGYLTGPSRVPASGQLPEVASPAPRYVADGRLDLDAVIAGFAAALMAERRRATDPFVEREARLLFLLFLTPIINGSGHYVVEPETRDSRRMDVVVFCGNREHIIELKIWHGPKAEAGAYDQLATYLRSRAQTEGWLINFTHHATLTTTHDTVACGEHTIHETTIAYPPPPG